MCERGLTESVTKCLTHYMKRRLATCGLLAAVSLCAAQRPGQPAYWAPGARDYTNNITATDSSRWIPQFAFLSAHPNPESLVGKVVYVKGQSPSLQWTFTNTSGLPIPGSISFTNFRIEFPNGSTYPLSVSPATQTVTIGAFPSTQTLTVSLGALPPYVSLGTIKGTITATSTQDVYQYAPNFQLFIPSGYPLMNVSASFERIYTTESTPTGVQEMPWTDLLEKTCGYAFGYSGSSNVAAALTRGRHADASWVYDPGAARYFQFVGSIDYARFALKDALLDPPGRDVNCFTIAIFLAIAMKSQGLPSSIARLVAYDYPGFVTTPLAGLGLGDPLLTSTYGQFAFSSHGVTLHNGLTYDATGAFFIGLNGQVLKQTAQGWNLPSYWQSPNPNPTPPWPYQYVGLVQSYLPLPPNGPVDNQTDMAGTAFDVTELYNPAQ